MANTSGNDVNFLQATDLGTVGAGAGNDRYILDAALLSPNQKITISDTQGANVLQLAGGLTITSAQVAANAIQFTLSNGALITVLGASTFTFITGGNNAGTGGLTQTFADFVKVSLGLSAVPTGATPVSTTAAITVNANGGTSAGGTGGAANTAPNIFGPSTLSAAEDAAASFTIGTSDAENNTVTVTASAANGTATFANGTVSYTGKQDFNGTDTITLTATDGKLSTTKVVAVNVAAVNDAPVLTTAAATLTTDEDTAGLITVSKSDVDGDTVTVTATATNGTVVDNKDGTFSYTGKQNFNGTDTVTLTANDGTTSVSKTVAVTVNPVNDAPTVTAPATLAAQEETAVTLKVTTADVDGDAVTVTATAANGTVVDNKDGSFTYTGSKDYAGADTITLTATDGKLTTNSTVAVTVANVNDAPVAAAATAAAAEAGPVVTGKLSATDVDTGDTHTFTLDAAVAGLTLNADGSYSFDATKNPTATALKYTDAPATIVANYTVADAAGAKAQSTLTLTVTPTPLSLTLVPSATFVEEGQTISYKLVASEAVATALTGSVQVVPGDGSTGNTAANDFGSGALNPQNVTIAAGATESTLFNLIPQNDATTEVPEAYTAKATVTGYTVANVTGAVRDPSTVGGVGQTFTLTDGVDSIPGLIGSAGSTGTDGDDTVVATNKTLSILDSIHGGLGNNTLKFSDVSPGGGTPLPAGLTVSNIQTVQLAAGADIGVAGVGKALDLSSWAGATSISTTISANAYLKASTSANVSVAGATGDVQVDGGKDVTVNVGTASKAITIGATTVNAGTVAVTDTDVGAADIKVDGGTNVSIVATGSTGGANTIEVGTGGAATDLPSGTVTVSSAHKAVVGVDAALSAIKVNGGTTVTVTQTADTSKAAADTVGSTLTQGAVTVNGGGKTTAVVVNQAKATAEVLASAAVAGVTETASVKFAALKAAETLVIGGLTFTANVAMTAAEAAQAFANLVDGKTQGAGPASKGIYTGAAFAGWSSGAVATDTVVFTSTASNANVADLANGGTGGAVITTTNGAKAAAAATGVLGVVAGNVTIDDAATASITTVTLDGYGTANIGAANTMSKLKTVSLTNSANAATVDAVGVATLDVNLSNVQHAVNLDGAADNALKTLNVTTTGADSSFALTAAAVETLTVGGTNKATFTADLAALKTVTVTGSAGLVLSGNESDTLTSVTTSGTTGLVSASIDGTKATYTGGAGTDVVTLLTGTALTKAINLGDGNDTLIFAAAVGGSTAALSGGTGTDTLSMGTARADALDAVPQTFYSAFERLLINDATASATVDLEPLGFTTHVKTSGSAGTLTLKNLANNGTVVMSAAGSTTIEVKDAATGTADVLNAELEITTANIDFGTVTAANVESVNLSAKDGDTTFGIQMASVILTADKATSVNLGTSNANLALTMTGSTKVTSIDGSAMTGTLAVTSVNATSATTIKGGSASDTLTAAVGASTADVLIGGAGNDTLTSNKGLNTLTGGAGNDVFVIGTASLNVNSYATITDFAVGDLIKMTGTATFTNAKVTLGATAVFQDYANAAAAALGNNGAGWFQHGGDTYLVGDVGGDSATFVEGTDLIVKLTGLVDLTNASFSATHSYIAL